MNGNAQWIERQTVDNDARRAYEKERLTVWALDAIAEAMARSGKTKADVARTLGTSRAHVTQALSGSRNVTLGTLADLAWAAGVRIDVRAEPLRYGDFIASPVQIVDSRPRVVCIKHKSSEAVSLPYDAIMGCG